MITIEELDRLLALMREAGLVHLEYADGTESVRLDLGAGAGPGPLAPQPDVAPATAAILTEGLGEFLDRHPTEDAPLVKSGGRIEAGQAVGYLKVGPTLSPVIAGVSGLAVRYLVEPGSKIGFATPVLELIMER